MSDLDYIGESIKNRRIKLGLSQVELSKKAHVKQSTISKIETSSGDYRIKTLSILLKSLNMKIKLK